MLRIPNRQNLLPKLYCTGFSVQKISTVYSNTVTLKHYSRYLLTFHACPFSMKVGFFYFIRITNIRVLGGTLT